MGQMIDCGLLLIPKIFWSPSPKSFPKYDYIESHHHYENDKFQLYFKMAQVTRPITTKENGFEVGLVASNYKAL